MPHSPSRDEIVSRGLELFRLMEAEPPALFKKDWWVGRVLQMTMSDPQFKLNLFRFIDVLPTLTTQELLTSHLEEYFRSEGAPATLLSSLLAGTKGGLAAGVTGRLLKRNIAAIARTFIAGETPEQALPGLRSLRDADRSFTMDLLGETALSEQESRAYGNAYLSLADVLARELSTWPRPRPERETFFPRLNVSVKLSSLYSRLGSMNYEDSVREGRDRLRPILRRVREAGGFVNLDMETYAVKNITIDVFTSLLSESEFRAWPHAGIALQAYLRETEADILRLAAWAGERGAPVTVRLVKGAYWEYETVIARQKGWPLPVFATKGETDRNFEQCAELLLARNDLLLPAFGSHNVRSLAAAMVAAERQGIGAERLEFQMLFGMAGPVKQAVGRLGFPVREYVPVGPLLPGMAYLVRRLLENTSNEGFLRRTFADRVEWTRLLAEPVTPSPAPSVPAPSGEVAPFANEPPLDLSHGEVRTACHAAVEAVRGRLGGVYPALVGGREWSGEGCVVSVNPACPTVVVGSVAAVGEREVKTAVTTALQVQREWGGRPAAERAAVLFRTAAVARKRRHELLAWQVFETGKNWVEADADVAEAIDYLEYYGREALRLDAPSLLGNAPGEVNRYLYRPLGVGVVIAPWNFPLAISAGMVAAPLVAGNAVLYKPSSLSPVNGWLLVSLLREAGVPPGVLSFLPGDGKRIGASLAGHADVDFVAFTGSREVGLAIAATAGRPGRRGIRRVVAEMGGKNAIIVDADADLDLAVAGVLQSAFGYQGQKCSACSRVIVLEQCYERFLSRLTEAVRGITVGPPEDPTFYLGPLIDRAAVERVQSCLEIGRREGRVVVASEAPSDGYFHGAAVVADLPPDSSLLREEVFGPLLAVVRAADMTEALAVANGVDYALTGGLYSRSPVNIARAGAEFAVGNLYINRPITGALVGRQPFGGFRFSGVGSKAGGPDYVRQFLQPQVVTENTMRRGFTPETL